MEAYTKEAFKGWLFLRVNWEDATFELNPVLVWRLIKDLGSEDDDDLGFKDDEETAGFVSFEMVAIKDSLILESKNSEIKRDDLWASTKYDTNEETAMPPTFYMLKNDINRQIEIW